MNKQLTFQNVDFFYGKKPILQNASIRIPAGKCIALLGPSGVGKTTVGRILAGYDVPKHGQVLLDKEPLPKKGYCPVQLIGQHPQLAFDERMKMKQSLKEAGMPPKENIDLLQQLGIQEAWLDRYPIELSGGELQRFAICRALHPTTKYLIADELSAMLDAVTQAKLWKLLLTFMRKYHLGILMITHNQALAQKASQQIVTLSNLQIHETSFS